MNASGTRGRRRGKGKRTLDLRQVIENILFELYPGTLMSSRQVFYQCQGPALANSQAEYKRLCRTLVDMRRDGTVPYSRIVDRTRSMHRLDGWDSAVDIIKTAANQYRRDMWQLHGSVPMIACEKQALEGILTEVCDEFGVALWIIRGFNSESFDYEWAEEIKRLNEAGKSVYIGYLGDHDPSGRVIGEASRKKLEGFGAVFKWERLGLHPEDLSDFNLELVPLKLGTKKKKGDPRANRFRTEFGTGAAELDALPPGEVPRRIREFVEPFIEPEIQEAVERDERVQKESLDVVMRNWGAAVQAARGAA